LELTEIGWNPGLAQAFAGFGSQGLIPARVARAHSVSYLVYAEAGELNAELTGRLRHLAGSSRELPTVGDWVAVRQVDQDRGMVHAVLPRKSCFSRREAGGRTKEGGGRTAEQVVAANVDTVFLVSDLDRDFNLRRMERYLTLVWDSGADPVIVLNKADRCDAVEARVAEMEGVACGVPIHPVSAVSGADQGADRGPAGVFRGGKVDADQLPGWPGGAGRGRGADRRWPGAAHHHPPGTGPAAGRRGAGRQSRDARGAVVG
jgi:ribosome biogenesis GTPase